MMKFCFTKENRINLGSLRKNDLSRQNNSKLQISTIGNIFKSV